MRTTALVVAGMVGLSALLVVVALAVSFDIAVQQAASQVLPVALAASVLAGIMVELERRAIW